ncbi:MAG: hypothetical protein EXQ93_05095 [Alphaproteobacteria bacterium]|nr:hypothetical protein [Alphaproteobacteria bacterium]
MRVFVTALCTGSALLGLAACTSVEDQIAADSAACARYGFQRGTDAFATCLMTLDQQRKSAPPRVGVGLGIGIGGRF